MRVIVLGLAALTVVVALPSGSSQASLAPKVTCRMPVRVPDSASTERMPVSRSNTAVPMPTELPRCSNPLFARRDSAVAGVLPNKRLEPTRP